MLLRHLHLPNVTSYLTAAKLQDRLVAKFLAHKANPTVVAAPEPTVITVQFNPIYTCGRREIGTVSLEQRQWLTQHTEYGQAEFHEALRGGQTTFHGPGQLVAYPILDLRQHRLTPRGYVCLLEKSVIELLGREYGILAKTTENPGVWTDDMHKICALGIHLRRNISSHGIGLNVSTELAWFDRIVACGLEGKSTTNMWQLLSDGEPNVEEVGDKLVKILGDKLDGVDGVVRIDDGVLD